MTAGTTQQPLVSIVTPFYNTAEYLEECILSVLEQTYSNWEYLLVNNQSTDGSFEIAERYARQDARIKLITQPEFLGQAENYNKSLEYISADSMYCKMIQADDILFSTCVSEMVRLAESDPSIGIVSSYYLNGVEVRNQGLPIETIIISGIEACRRYLIDSQFLFGTPSTILVRSEIVRSRRPYFVLDSDMDDTEACFQIMQTANFGFVHQILSYSRDQSDSITSKLLPLNPYILDDLILLKKYGRNMLTQKEYTQTWNRRYRAYMQFIAKSTLQLRRRTFWQYHSRGLAKIDCSLSGKTLAPYLVAELLSKIMNPGLTLRGLLRRVVGTKKSNDLPSMTTTESP